MRRSIRPNLEPLEGKALLSDLAVKLTTDHAAYRAGQPVHMALTETNVSRHDIKVYDGPCIDGFLVTRDGVEVWRSNSGFQPCFIVVRSLHPLESFTVRATWVSPPAGTFVVRNQLASGGPSATVRVEPKALTVAVRTDHQTYKAGQTVQITITETNTSGQDVKVAEGCRILSASVTRGGKPVWLYRDARACATFRGVLHAGESRKYHLTWDGHPNVPGARLTPGAYEVAGGLDGVLGVTTIRVIA